VEKKLKIALLASGKIGFIAFEKLIKEYEISLVMTDRSSTDIINLSVEKKYPLFIGNPRGQKSFDLIKDKTVDILLSVNYLFIIEKDLINLPSKLAFNIHGSLLPKYRGRTPHVWAIINNESNTGVTAHVIDEKCDTGPIIKQILVPIEPNDTGAIILEKYAKIYYPLIKDVLIQIEKGAIQLTPQNESIATFFGKRSPEDGHINWNWQKERIYNWIRALSHPYPGAFTLIGNNKLFIDSIEFSDYGFNFEMPNGLIISVMPFLIKTSNGVVKVTKFRNTNINIQKGFILK
jgi:methionyl-tRNA formyltransferase